MSSTDVQQLMLDVAKGFGWCVKEPKGEFFNVLAFGCAVLSHCLIASLCTLSSEANLESSIHFHLVERVSGEALIDLLNGTITECREIDSQ